MCVGLSGPRQALVIYRIGELFTWSQVKQSLGYLCPLCRTKYSPLDALIILDPTTGSFRCEVCRLELVEDEEDERFRGKDDLFIK